MLTLLRDLRNVRRTLGLRPADRPGSLAVRHVDCGSCNGCEHELTLASGPTVDMARYGLGIVASPRHADVLLVTGPVTTRMHAALLVAYNAMPEPRRVVALGDCTVGQGLIAGETEIVGRVEDVLPVDLRIPGCPPTPTVDRGCSDRADRPWLTRAGADAGLAAGSSSTPALLLVVVAISVADHQWSVAGTALAIAILFALFTRRLWRRR